MQGILIHKIHQEKRRKEWLQYRRDSVHAIREYSTVSILSLYSPTIGRYKQFMGGLKNMFSVTYLNIYMCCVPIKGLTCKLACPVIYWNNSIMDKKTKSHC